MKFLEVAATFDCLEVLAGRPYKGDDWDGCNALLCCTFMESVPPSIYFKIRHRTMHENFKYLVKQFRDNDPIPCTNELQCTGTAAAAETPEKSPTSDITATEWHASTERNNEDLSTKALTRGTQDVNDGNVGRTQDPHMSLEASAKGNSAKCTEMTSVILESVLHKMQNLPQDLLLLTPRLPIEGEPNRCKQEVADSVVMAGRTNGTVKLAEPTEITDIDGMALLGREPAERARGISEGNEMEREAQLRLQELKLLCREIIQCSGIANEDIPSVQKLPLEGEWTVCMSSELLTMTVELYANDGNGNACVYLGGMCWHAGDASCPKDQSDGSGCQTDVPRGSTDLSRAWTDTLNVSDSTEMNAMSDREGAGTYLATGDPKCLIHETDGDGVHADTSSGCRDAPSIETKAIKPANKTQIVSIP